MIRLAEAWTEPDRLRMYARARFLVTGKVIYVPGFRLRRLCDDLGCEKLHRVTMPEGWYLVVKVDRGIDRDTLTTGLLLKQEHGNGVWEITVHSMQMIQIKPARISCTPTPTPNPPSPSPSSTKRRSRTARSS